MPIDVTTIYKCDGCGRTMPTKEEYDAHVPFPGTVKAGYDFMRGGWAEIKFQACGPWADNRVTFRCIVACPCCLADALAVLSEKKGT